MIINDSIMIVVLVDEYQLLLWNDINNTLEYTMNINNSIT